MVYSHLVVGVWLAGIIAHQVVVDHILVHWERRREGLGHRIPRLMCHMLLISTCHTNHGVPIHYTMYMYTELYYIRWSPYSHTWGTVPSLMN